MLIVILLHVCLFHQECFLFEVIQNLSLPLLSVTFKVMKPNHLIDSPNLETLEVQSQVHIKTFIRLVIEVSIFLHYQFLFWQLEDV